MFYHTVIVLRNDVHASELAIFEMLVVFCPIIAPLRAQQMAAPTLPPFKLQYAVNHSRTHPVLTLPPTSLLRKAKYAKKTLSLKKAGAQIGKFVGSTFN